MRAHREVTLPMIWFIQNEALRITMKKLFVSQCTKLGWGGELKVYIDNLFLEYRATCGYEKKGKLSKTIVLY